MPAPINPTAARLTDNVVDKVLSRLGNDGVSMGDDFVTRLDQALGLPIELTAQSPATTALNVGASVYTMPNGVRVAVVDDGVFSALAAGVVDFQAGTISTGTNATFTTPTIPANNWVRALVQYKPDTNALNVTYGTMDPSVTNCSIPALLDDYQPVYLIEIQANGLGTGIQPIANANIVKIAGGFKSQNGPAIEVQNVASSPKTVFTLTTIVIPRNRSRLLVLQNGILMTAADDYAVTSDTVVTMTNPVPVNGRVTFLVI